MKIQEQYPCSCVVIAYVEQMGQGIQEWTK